MTIKIVVDMNLSPEWIPLLKDFAWEATHWSAIGDPRACDTEITAWARTHGFVVFTHDLNFGTTLALTHAAGPGVLQLRDSVCFPSIFPSRSWQLFGATRLN